MPTNILSIGYEYNYSGVYQFTTTREPDEDYRKYLARKLRDVLPVAPENHTSESFPVDISMDDVEGDVVAGISAVIDREVLVIDLLWVDEPLRDQGVGRRLTQMAEDVARARVTAGIPFFVGQGYAITGTIQELPSPQAIRAGKVTGQAVYWLSKELE